MHNITVLHIGFFSFFFFFLGGGGGGGGRGWGEGAVVRKSQLILAMLYRAAPLSCQTSGTSLRNKVINHNTYIYQWHVLLVVAYILHVYHQSLT